MQRFFEVACDLWAQERKRLAVLEFDRVRKSMGVIVRTIKGGNKLLVKVRVYMKPPIYCL
jgi:magnesium-transporting ATPase (P-type)